MRIIIVIKLFDVFKARELNFLNGVISSAINFSLFKILEKDLSDGIIIRISRLGVRSKEVLAFQVSNSTDSKLIMDTLDELTENIPEGIKPIIHSDQGWHYQLNYYTDKLSEKKFIQSMSRKGNCLDNAPIESFFHLLKTECLNGFPQCKDIGEFKEITKNYVDWFNNRRISQKTKGMTPCEYREHALAV